MIGTKLGPYEITAKLGEGGMGLVYRAKDSQLGREVALKVLPEGLTADPERLARFEREAKLLASLNHPNIAQIYGLETSGGSPALVMELVEGPTLADRLAQGSLSVDESLSIARQIAEALEEAHEKGIIHRDLKPQNVKASMEGKVKVLDFGLAKAMDPAGAASGSRPGGAAGGGAVNLTHSPTLTSPAMGATVAGVILGTAAYMSPEQARGQAVDKRSDIWSFGVVLWEMLTGDSLFGGETVSDTLAAILTREPDLSELPASTPPALRRLLSRCLERNPKDRLRDIGDAALELRDVTPAGGPEPAPAGVPSAGGSALRRVLWWPLVALAIVTSAAAAWMLWHVTPSGGAARSLVSFEPKTFEREVIFNARFLPHDQGIVYSAATTGNVPELFMLTPEALAPKRLAPPGTHLLSISSDGELAVLTGASYLNQRFFEGTLARMTLDGSPRPLVDRVREADWGPGGTLAIVRRAGGTDRLEYPLGKVLYETSGYVSEPRVSPDGERVAFLDHQWWLDDRGRVKVVDRSGKVQTLSEEFWAVEGLAWSKDGQTLFFSGVSGAVELQPRAVTLQGAPSRQVLSVPDSLSVLDVDHDGDWLAIKEQLRYGVVAHPKGGSDIDLSWLDSCWGPSLSADGRTLLFTNGRGGGNYTVVTRRLDGSPITTLGEGNSYGFSPDGAWVAANIASPPGVVLYPTGAGTARHLELGPIEKVQYLQWFPDGKSLLIRGSESSGVVREYREQATGGTPEPATPEGVAGLLKPDGTAVLAQDGSGDWKLYPLSEGEPSAAHGLRPDDQVWAWDRDGASVFVHQPAEVPAQIERVDLSTGQRSVALTIAPQERVGLLRTSPGRPVFDASGDYSYEYVRVLSRLYFVHGAGS
jgi:hypothetical protein